LDDDEPRVDDFSAARERSRHDPVRAWRKRVASDAATQRHPVDSSVTADAKTPDAAAIRRHLDDDKLDNRTSAQHEDERRPSLLLRPAPGDPVACETEAINMYRARSGTLLLAASAGGPG
jgi:hypothetical protein